MKVVIFEDNSELADEIRTALTTASVDVSIADLNDVKGWRGKLRAELVICDLDLDRWSYVDVINAVDPACRPTVVFISGRGQDLLSSAAVYAKSLSVQVVGLLAKPFSVLQLSKIVESLALQAASCGSVVIPIGHVGGPTSQVQRYSTPFAAQPIYRSSDLLCVGAEVLLWRVEERSPEAAASESVLNNRPPSNAVGLWDNIFFSQIAGIHDILTEYKDTLDADFFVSVNMPWHIVADATLFSRLKDFCHEQSFVEGIVLEVNEAEVGQIDASSMAAFSRLRLFGFGLALDDVGAGDAGLRSVSQLPATHLKLDKSLLHGARLGGKGAAVLEGMIAFGQKAGCKVVVEGIERASDLQLARLLGADYLQGYFLSGKIAWDLAIRNVVQSRRDWQ